VIEWAAPWAFILLPLPWLVWRFMPPFRERTKAIRVPFFDTFVAAMGATPREGVVVPQRSKVDTAIAILLWLLLVIALAQPQRLGDRIEIKQAARDVILAIDISGSMDVKDFKASDGTEVQRLLAVKRVVQDFVKKREGDRVALIVFGSRAYVQSPFTEDLKTLGQLLDETSVGMAGPNTVIGDSIGLAIRTFESSKVDQRLLILLSDGSDTGSRMTPLNAATIAAQRGVSIFTIAVGDPDASPDSKYIVDVDTLQEIASRSGGEYFFAGDEKTLETVYSRIDELTPRKTQTLSYQPREALAYLPIAVAAVLLCLYALIRQFPVRRKSQA